MMQARAVAPYRACCLPSGAILLGNRAQVARAGPRRAREQRIRAFAQGSDPTDSPKVPQRDAIPGSAEQLRPLPPDSGERAQRMAEAEADVTEMDSHKQGSIKREGEGDQGASTAEGATTSEKGAAKERFEGILEAMDTLAAEEEEPPSPHHPSEVSAGAGKGAGEEDTDQLTKEALSTMQPGDIMPRPGDKYLPQSMKPHERPDQGPAARLNKPHTGPFKQTVTTPPSTAGLMPAASAPRSPSGRMVARAEPQQAGSRAPGAADAADTDKLDNYDDQMELSAVPGGDQAVSGSDLETKALDTDDQAGVGDDQGEELFPVEKDALKGSDAMYYFKSDDKPGLQEASSPKTEQQSSFRAAMETAESGRNSQQEQQQAKQVSGQKAKGADNHNKQDRAEEPHRESVIRSLQNKAKDLQSSAAQPQQHRHHRPNPLQATQAAAKETQQQLSSTASRTVEVALGRSALLGLACSLVSEFLTNQSVLSQLLGRYEGGLQVEHPVHLAQQAAMLVGLACLALTAGEELFTWKLAPSWQLLGLGPRAQLWLGRLAMVVFAGLVMSETLHSNRPAFSTLFYTFF